MTVRRRAFWVSCPRGPLDRERLLFTLAAGELGRYRLNFRSRLTQCQCAPAWIYEYWVIQVANARSSRDTFLSMTPSFDVDERAHLYGGATTLRNCRQGT